MDIKENIRRIIEAKPGATMRGIGLKAGLSDSALHKFLTKDAQSMSVKNLQAVAEALEVDIRAFFSSAPDPEVRAPSEEMLEDFLREVFDDEVRAETKLSDLPRIFASALHEQIKQPQSGAAVLHLFGARSAPEEAAPVRAPTTKSGRGESRNA